MDFSNINWLAVLVITIASFALGALWYGKVFGKIWQREVGMNAESMKDANLAKIFGTCLLLTGIMGIGMAFLVQGHGQGSIGWQSGLHHGLFVGVFFIACSTGINYLYQRKSITLWLIDAGYQITFLAMMGAVLGVWH